MKTALLVLVISLVIVILLRKPTQLDKHAPIPKGEIFLPTEPSTFLPGLCRTVLYKQNDLVFSVYDCGPESTADVVVLLHGFPDNAKTFRKQIEPFANAGFRTIIPTLRGYEPSSQSKEGYHITQLGNDVISITKALNIEKFHIIGHDWGAIISQGMGIYYPEKIKSIVSVAVPPQMFLTPVSQIPLKQLSYSWYMYFFQIPVIPDISIAYSESLIRKLYNSWSPTFDWNTDAHLKEVLQTFQSENVPSSAIQYYRENLFYILSECIARSLSSAPDTLYYEHPLLGLNRVPNLLITGKSDGCIMTELYDLPAKRSLASYQVERLDGGHFIHYENPTVFNDITIRFLQNHSSTNQTRQ